MESEEHMPANMGLDLNKYQRAALLAAAAAIVLFQFAQLDEYGLEGYGWILSFLVAGTLAAVAMSKATPPSRSPKSAPDTTSPRAPAPRNTVPSKEELKIAHAKLRENAEVLAIEVEERAKILARSLAKEQDPESAKVFDVLGGKSGLREKFVDQIRLHIDERCLLLMLGLVGMRRSKGKKVYITGIEYKTLQAKISDAYLKMVVASVMNIPDPPEVNTKAISTSVMSDLQSIRTSIVRYCIVLEQDNADNSERELLDWFKKSSAIDLTGNQHVTQALEHHD